MNREQLEQRIDVLRAELDGLVTARQQLQTQLAQVINGLIAKEAALQECRHWVAALDNQEQGESEETE